MCLFVRGLLVISMRLFVCLLGCSCSCVSVFVLVAVPCVVFVFLLVWLLGCLIVGLSACLCVFVGVRCMIVCGCVRLFVVVLVCVCARLFVGVFRC